MDTEVAPREQNQGLSSAPLTPRVLMAVSLCVSPSIPFMKGEFIWFLLGPWLVCAVGVCR